MRPSFRLAAPVLVTLVACGGDSLTGLHNKAPIADAGHDLSSVVGETIRFDGSHSTDADGEVASWSWTFGDGASAIGKVVTHAYAAAGAYDVKLTVTDDEGAKGSATIHATITNPDAPPVAVIVVSTNAAETGDEVDFDASQSTDDGTIVGYAWDFGDGATATTEQATHAFLTAGAFTVTLTVTDDAGQQGEAETVVRVEAPPPPPPDFPATYSYGPVNSSRLSQCPDFHAALLKFTVSGSTLSICEGSCGGLSGATYNGSIDLNARTFSATTARDILGMTQTLAGTFSTDFRSFDGTYSGGTCSAPLNIHGTRTSPP